MFERALALAIAAMVGAVLGSFVNVVVSRGPRAWGLVDAKGKPKGLAYPRSQCEGCGTTIAPYDLVPLLSFVWLRGKCRHCSAPIGGRHLIVETLGLLIGILIVWKWGLSIEAATAGYFLLTLTALAAIDAETGYLPDALTLPLLAVGLVIAALGYGPPLFEALLGVALGSGGLWLLASLYKAVRGWEGLGGGDIKLLGAAGAWLGPWVLPYVVLVASVTGLVFISMQMLRGKKERSLTTELRFGPFLAAAMALILVVSPPF